MQIDYAVGEGPSIYGVDLASKGLRKWELRSDRLKLATQRISSFMAFYPWTFIRTVTFIGAAAIVLGTQAPLAQDLSTPSQWPDTPTSRVQALAVLQTLNAQLLSNASATLTLDSWCALHKLAPGGSRIVAHRVRGQDKPADALIRELLAVGPDEPVSYRRVHLACGNRILSEADNWYVPARLTADMNNALNTTDISFGRAVQSLKFTRTNLSAELLWSPLPKGWEMGAELPASAMAPLAVPPFLLEHHAVLKLRDGTPFSALIESYTSSVLDFPAPHVRPR
ncbi:hypothetical protein ACVJBD_007295 [Rhizobium mongolense]